MDKARIGLIDLSDSRAQREQPLVDKHPYAQRRKDLRPEAMPNFVSVIFGRLFLMSPCLLAFTAALLRISGVISTSIGFML